MAFPEIRLVEFPRDALGTTVEKRAGAPFDARQMSEKGFDFQRGAAAAYVADPADALVASTAHFPCDGATSGVIDLSNLTDLPYIGATGSGDKVCVAIASLVPA